MPISRRQRVARTNAAEGTVLLLALLIMSSVVIASLGLGTLILNSLQQTRVIDNAVIAYYAAESGAEEAMYQARAQDALPSSVTSAQTLTNGATWKRDVTGTENVLYLTILRDQFAELALYDPDAETQSLDVARVDIDWQDSCAGCSVLTASRVSWPVATPFTWDGDTATFKYTGGFASISIDGSTRLSRLRLRADNGDLINVRIRAYNSANQLVNIPGRIKIVSRGSFGNVLQRLTVTLPRRTPLSGIYDFAVFSECSLVKGGTISCP